jgi:dCTP deaminase
MTVLSAQTLRRVKPIKPFMERTAAHGMTFGLSACGYDVRIAENFVAWPSSFNLASTIEQFEMPDDCCAMVMDKSTWARRGICVQNTIIEPGWNGYLTLEITNHHWWPVRLIAGMPIAQIVFHKLDEPTEMPYRGKYQNQAAGPQAARLLHKI